MCSCVPADSSFLPFNTQGTQTAEPAVTIAAVVPLQSKITNTARTSIQRCSRVQCRPANFHPPYCFVEGLLIWLSYPFC